MESLERHREAVRARLSRSGLVPPGPGSVFWKVNREVVVGVGWGRAILLQLAHPAIAAGVRDHSSFRGSLLANARRLRSTVRAMLAITFGDVEERIEAVARIHAIHDRVRGPGYTAHDPELQRWVHVTLLESMPRAYALLVRPLTAREHDRYCAEAAIMEPLMGLPEGWLPRDVAQLDACLRPMMEGGRLAVTDTGRELAHAILRPPHRFLAWPVFRGIEVLTLGTLPPAIRRAYGFGWSPRDARAFRRWVGLLRTSRRLLPPRAREWPQARRPDGTVHTSRQEVPEVGPTAQAGTR